MKRFLKNKKGVTLLEGLIALLLLTVVATGTFGVLLSVSRKSNATDIRAEMTAAVARVKDEMKARRQYLPYKDDGGETYCDGKPKNDLSCYLPPICDKNNNSSFTFVYDDASYRAKTMPFKQADLDTDITNNLKVPAPVISFHIECNGFTL